MKLKTRVGGELFGRKIRLGRGSECALYRRRSWEAVSGREV